MTGLAWSAVLSGEFELPPMAVQTLAAEDMAVTAHHAKLWRTLDEVVGTLGAAGIGTVTFKGVTDEARWFHRTGERPCADVDVVIDDIDRFDDAIAALMPTHQLIGQATRIARRGQARAIDLPIGDVTVDLHVDPVKVGPGWVNPKTWWSHTEPYSTPSGDIVRVFDREATTALRLLHLGRDRFRTLLGLVEVQRLADAGVDWSIVRTLADMEGVGAPVGVAAEVVAEELRVEPFLTPSNDWRTRWWRKLWKPEMRLLGELARVRYVRRSQWLLPLSMPGRVFETLAWMGRTAVPPAALFDLKHPGHDGPYAWRLIAARNSYLVKRRLNARMQKRA